MKKKLFAAVVSLVVATVMMTSASFAWFTVSTAPEVQKIEVKMEATENLEIAKATDMSTAPSEVTANDTGDETKWGGLVTSFSGAEIQFPATVSDGSIKTIQYDYTGRTANSYETATAPTAFEVSGSTNLGYGYYTADVKKLASPSDVTPAVEAETVMSGVKVAAVYGIWLRTNTDLTGVQFSVDKSSIAVKDSSDTAVVWGYKEGTTRYTDAEAVKVAVMAQGVSSSAYDGTYAIKTEGTDTGAGFDLIANTAELIYVVVYVDGDCCIAESVAKDFTVSGLGVKFNVNATPDPATFSAQHTAST